MTGRRLQAFRHVGFEDLGSFEAPLRAAGYEIEYVEMADCDPAALDPLAPDLLVVLGGPIGVHDHEAYPIVSIERGLLEARLRGGRPTLGLCLGAQLMAAALGARVSPGPSKEIGWSALEPDAGRTEAPARGLRKPSRPPLARRHLRSAGRLRSSCLHTALPQSGLRAWN